MTDCTSVPMRPEKMGLIRQQAARVYAARDYAFTVSTDVGHEWTDADIAALTAPGKFLPGLARLMATKTVWEGTDND